MKNTSAGNGCGHEHFPVTTKHNLLTELDLAPRTKAAAATLEAKFPGKVTFTSGRRSVSDQAKPELRKREGFQVSFIRIRKGDQGDQIQLGVEPDV